MSFEPIWALWLKKIKEQMKLRDISQVELAGLLGQEPSIVCEFYKGTRFQNDIMFMFHIMAAVGIEPWEHLKYSEEFRSVFTVEKNKMELLLEEERRKKA